MILQHGFSDSNGMHMMYMFLVMWIYWTCCPGAMDYSQKKLLVSVAVLPAPIRVPSQRPLASSVASVMSVANDKGHNWMILGTVHRSPGICLTAEGKHQNTSARRSSDEGALRSVIASNEVPFSKWGRYDHTAHQEGRRKKIRKGRGRDWIYWSTGSICSICSPS